ncbi:hypothetical protein PGAG_00313 [Phaeocystis globosa virus 12T]|uniref:Uncharacterized protein n=1 Tax=Phaeocystis globosa virus PgV-16T TaxID=3071227 RepID=A0AC59EXN0_9VIRU|nr:hypothetical protein PGCG_00352 [Phaeocystis globosa virus]AET73202.1 hypothetical protein PGAG_00313 [Phaeocystis globosa virus 12T]AET74026.1 hypothetical protein PGBG_00318 [Phaeocystis globosa virus 14T]AGM15663.1 hypothetical protein PGCG_00352 [Phaeocystis globosa virus PgV-16T]UYE94393.1 hypothetical protein PGV14T_00352 [Phaeocystis globosa virus]
MASVFGDLPYDIQEKIYFMRLEQSTITINHILTRAYYNKTRRKTDLQEMIMRLPQYTDELETFHNPFDVNVRNTLFMALRVLTHREVSIFGAAADWWHISFLQPVKRGLELMQYEGGPYSNIYNETESLYNKLLAKFDCLSLLMI